jgi:Protein phosphatase 2C
MKMHARRHRSANLSHRTPAPIWNAVTASAKGRRHQSSGEPCEDIVGRVFHKGIYVVALADGAGSARLARDGATIAVDAALSYLKRNFRPLASAPSEQGGKRVIAHIRGAMERAANTRGVLLADLACTLLFAANDGRTLLVGQLGDGRVAVRNVETNNWQSVHEPTRGEYANETCFITSSNYAEKFALARYETRHVNACILMSDGAEASLFNRISQEFAQAVEIMAGWTAAHPQQQVEAAIEGELVRLMTSKTFDDVSLALLVQTG